MLQVYFIVNRRTHLYYIIDFVEENINYARAKSVFHTFILKLVI